MTAFTSPLYAQASDPRLQSLFDEYWEAQTLNFPTWATYLGDHRYDAMLTEHSVEAYARRLEQTRGFLDRIRAIPLDGLTSADSLNHMLFETMLADDVEGAAFKDYLMPVSQQGGPPSDFAELPTYHPFNTVADYDNYIERLHAFPAMIDQVMANMAEGIRLKLTPARVTMDKVIPQLDALIVRDPKESILAGPLEKFPEGIDDTAKTRIKTSVLRAVRNDVTPAYRRLRDFVRDRYLRACRTDAGIWALPDGQARYEYTVRHHTTTPMTAEEIHKLGETEVARIRGEMRRVTNTVGHQGTLESFMDALRVNPRFYYQSEDSLMQGFRRILKEMDRDLSKLFGRLPKQWYDLRAIEAFRAPAAPAAYYYSAPDDGSRPAYFYVNTYQIETRPKFTMEALAYHEAVPGHHLQITIQQELKNLPNFRRHGGHTAFVEGWALYSEQLPKEVAKYRDPYSEFGRLTFEAWRAVRLVVDTGIHHFKWTREQAIDYMRKNTALSENDIISEVERYIASPGQALAYKIGQLKILDLRQRAERALAGYFDVRTFHDALLEEGSLPLNVLDAKMSRWLAAETERARLEQAAEKPGN
jgi:uncharacterized protein (DUF885 family)